MVKKLFKIGEIMEHSGLSRQVIHNYTQLQLIYEARRTLSGHRLYAEDTLKQLDRIKRLKSRGKTLSEIRELLNGRKQNV